MRFGPRTAAAFVAMVLASPPVVASAVPSTVSFISMAPEPSDPEAPVTVTVVVTAGDAGADGGGSGVPTGSVTVGTTTNSDRCTADLDGGVGTCVLSIASTGEVAISAQYSGDTLYDPSSNNTSHGVLVPPFTIAGPSETAYDAGIAVTFSGLQVTGTAEVFVDGVSQQLLVYGSDGAVPSGVTLFFDPSYSVGCHSISAVNDDASAPPLGIFLDPTGIADAASPCKAAIVTGGLAGASMALGSLQPGLSGAIEAQLREPMAAANAVAESLLLSQLDERIAAPLGGMIPPPIAGIDLAANVLADAGAALQVTFFLSNNAGDASADASAAVSGPHTLLFFDSVTDRFQAVQPPLAEVAVDGGSRAVVTLNASSYPSVAQLAGTMFFLVLTEDFAADGGPESGLSDAGAEGESDAATADAATEDATVDATLSDSGDGGGVDATVMDAMDAASLGDAAASAVDSTARDAALPTESGGGGGAEAATIDGTQRSGDGSPQQGPATSGESSASGCGCRVAGPTGSPLPPLAFAVLGLRLLLAELLRRRVSEDKRSKLCGASPAFDRKALDARHLPDIRGYQRKPLS